MTRTSACATLTGGAGFGPALLVGDPSGLAKKGAAISFYMDKGKVRFEVSIKAVKGAGLKMSSKLAKIVA